MRRISLITLLLSGSTGLTFAVAPRWAWVAPAMGLAAGIIWAATACRHAHPTLQPAMRGANGAAAVPARWLCNECGTSWEADFSKVQTPVVRYAGFDEAKATDAARRARDLEVRRRALAIDRAGQGISATLGPSHIVTHRAGEPTRRAS